MAPLITVYVTDTFPREAKEVLSEFEVVELGEDPEVIARSQALICWPGRAKPELLRAMKGLRMIQTMSAGVERLDFGSVPKGVRVFSNAGAFTESVAEHAWGLLLGAAKGIHLRHQRTAPRELRGKTLLVLGGGSIGSEVARLGKSLSMRTVGVSRSFKDPGAFDEVASMDRLPARFADADAVVIALPLTVSTKGMVDHRILSMAKGEVIVVNVGRGDCVVEEDMIRWLKERPESRYATDVFWTAEGRERFETAAWDLPNFAGTLHIAGAPLGEDLVGPKVAAAKNVKRFFDTGEGENPVDTSEYLRPARESQSG